MLMDESPIELTEYGRHRDAHAAEKFRFSVVWLAEAAAHTSLGTELAVRLACSITNATTRTVNAIEAWTAVAVLVVDGDGFRLMHLCGRRKRGKFFRFSTWVADEPKVATNQR